MEIRVYNSNLDLMGIIENQRSLIWTRRYFTVGEFELYVPNTEDNRRLLKLENIIYMYGNDEAGVIESITLQEGVIFNEIVCKGRFLTSYLDRRITKSTKNYRGNIETIINKMVFEDTIPIPRLIRGSTVGISTTADFQCTYKNLLTYVEKLVMTGLIGFRIKPNFNTKQLVLETYQGTDKTINQGVTNRVIFSEMYENLNNVMYRESSQNYKTMMYIGGQGEGDERTVVSVGSGTGLDLREQFHSGADLSPDEMTLTEYQNLLKQRAAEKLDEESMSISFECETSPNVNYTYKVDYDLGDIVTIKKKTWGITENLRITELMEVYENGSMTVIPTFGNPLPTTINWEDE